MTANTEDVSTDGASPAADPLLADDLGTLLGLFPNEALRAILDIMAGHTSWSPFPGRRATAARRQPADADLRPFARDIAREVMWWGANDLHRGPGHEDTWSDLVGHVANSEGSNAKDLAGLAAWQSEQVLLAKVFSRWEQMSPEERDELILQSGAGLAAARGGAVAAGGGVMAVMEALLVAGGIRLPGLLAARLAPLAVATPAVPFLAPV